MWNRLKQVVGKFSRDTDGSMSAVSLMLVTTIVAIGAIVGLTVIRDHIVQEFGDAAVGLDHLDQTFSYTITVDVDGNGVIGPGDYTLTTSYADVSTLLDPAGGAPACLNLNSAPPGEGG